MGFLTSPTNHMDMSSVLIGIGRENREDEEQYDSKFPHIALSMQR